MQKYPPEGLVVSKKPDFDFEGKTYALATYLLDGFELSTVADGPMGADHILSECGRYLAAIKCGIGTHPKKSGACWIQNVIVYDRELKTQSMSRDFYNVEIRLKAFNPVQVSRGTLGHRFKQRLLAWLDVEIIFCFDVVFKPGDSPIEWKIWLPETRNRGVPWTNSKNRKYHWNRAPDPHYSRPFGLELAEKVAKRLRTDAHELAYSHRDYCGTGFRYEAHDGSVVYAKFWDGYVNPESAHILKRFDSIAEFTAWLAVQSDESLNLSDLQDSWLKDNQTITRARLLAFTE